MASSLYDEFLKKPNHGVKQFTDDDYYNRHIRGFDCKLCFDRDLYGCDLVVFLNKELQFKGVSQTKGNYYTFHFTDQDLYYFGSNADVELLVYAKSQSDTKYYACRTVIGIGELDDNFIKFDTSVSPITKYNSPEFILRTCTKKKTDYTVTFSINDSGTEFKTGDVTTHSPLNLRGWQKSNISIENSYKYMKQNETNTITFNLKDLNSNEILYYKTFRFSVGDLGIDENSPPSITSNESYYLGTKTKGFDLDFNVSDKNYGDSITITASIDKYGFSKIFYGTGSKSLTIPIDELEKIGENTTGHMIKIIASDGKKSDIKEFTFDIGTLYNTPSTSWDSFKSILTTDYTYNITVQDDNVTMTRVYVDGVQILESNSKYVPVKITEEMLRRYGSFTNHTVKINIRNSHNKYIEKEFNFKVGDMNRSPILTSDYSYNLGTFTDAFHFTFNVNDADNDNLSTEVYIDNTLKDTIKGSGLNRIDVTKDDIEKYGEKTSHKIKLRTNDGRVYVEKEFKFDIGTLNEAPKIITTYPENLGTKSEPFVVYYNITDRENDNTKTRVKIENVLDIDYGNDKKCCIPVSYKTLSKLGQNTNGHKIIVSTTDGNRTTTKTFIFNIGILNYPPVILTNCPDYLGPRTEPFSIYFDISDKEKDKTITSVDIAGITTIDYINDTKCCIPVTQMILDKLGNNTKGHKIIVKCSDGKDITYKTFTFDIFMIDISSEYPTYLGEKVEQFSVYFNVKDKEGKELITTGNVDGKHEIHFDKEQSDCFCVPFDLVKSLGEGTKGHRINITTTNGEITTTKVFIFDIGIFNYPPEITSEYPSYLGAKSSQFSVYFNVKDKENEKLTTTVDVAGIYKINFDHENSDCISVPQFVLDKLDDNSKGHKIIVSCTDGHKTSYKEFTFDLRLKNNPPIIDIIGDKDKDGIIDLGVKDDAFSINYSFNDPDEGDELTVVVKLNENEFDTFKSEGGENSTFIDFDTLEKLGRFTTNKIIVSIIDSSNAVVSQVYRFTVGDLNHPPIISGEDSDLGTLNEVYNVNYTVSDVDENQSLEVTEIYNGEVLNVKNDVKQNENQHFKIHENILLASEKDKENKIIIRCNDNHVNGMVERKFTFKVSDKLKFDRETNYDGDETYNNGRPLRVSLGLKFNTSDSLKTEFYFKPGDGLSQYDEDDIKPQPGKEDDETDPTNDNPKDLINHPPYAKKESDRFSKILKKFIDLYIKRHSFYHSRQIQSARNKLEIYNVKEVEKLDRTACKHMIFSDMLLFYLNLPVKMIMPGERLNSSRLRKEIRYKTMRSDEFTKLIGGFAIDIYQNGRKIPYSDITVTLFDFNVVIGISTKYRHNNLSIVLHEYAFCNETTNNKIKIDCECDSNVLYSVYDDGELLKDDKYVIKNNEVSIFNKKPNCKAEVVGYITEYNKLHTVNIKNNLFQLDYMKDKNRFVIDYKSLIGFKNGLLIDLNIEQIGANIFKTKTMTDTTIDILPLYQESVYDEIYYVDNLLKYLLLNNIDSSSIHKLFESGVDFINNYKLNNIDIGLQDFVDKDYTNMDYYNKAKIKKILRKDRSYYKELLNLIYEENKKDITESKVVKLDKEYIKENTRKDDDKDLPKILKRNIFKTETVFVKVFNDKHVRLNIYVDGYLFNGYIVTREFLDYTHIYIDKQAIKEDSIIEVEYFMAFDKFIESTTTINKTEEKVYRLKLDKALLFNLIQNIYYIDIFVEDKLIDPYSIKEMYESENEYILDINYESNEESLTCKIVNKNVIIKANLEVSEDTKNSLELALPDQFNKTELNEGHLMVYKCGRVLSRNQFMIENNKIIINADFSNGEVINVIYYPYDIHELCYIDKLGTDGKVAPNDNDYPFDEKFDIITLNGRRLYDGQFKIYSDSGMVITNGQSTNHLAIYMNKYEICRRSIDYFKYFFVKENDYFDEYIKTLLRGKCENKEINMLLPLK